LRIRSGLGVGDQDVFSSNEGLPRYRRYFRGRSQPRVQLIMGAALIAGSLCGQRFYHGLNGALMNMTGDIKSSLTVELDAIRRACTPDCAHELSGEQ